MNRIDILNTIIDGQQKQIDNLKYSVERYTTASDLEEDETIDPDDLSQQVQAKEMQLRFEQLLNKAKEEMAFLQSELAMTHTKIEKGSLVDLGSLIIFVGISVAKFDVESSSIIGLSMQAPAYKNLQDKNIGDKVDIGNQSYKIVSIM